MSFDVQWRDIMVRALDRGARRDDRTGVGTMALFGEMQRFDLRDGFPAATTKQLAFGQVAAELACFLRGYSTLEQFHGMGCRIWDGNGGSDYWQLSARREGDLGRIYGVQWREWRSASRDGGATLVVDQLRELLNGLSRDPHSRRHLVTAWNPGELADMCLPPCHVMFQAFRDGEWLDLLVYMRSVDLFLGYPFDVASYALLQHLLCKHLGGCEPRRLTFALGDAHVYLNHREQVDAVVKRTPLEPPELALHDGASPLEFEPWQARLLNYKHCGAVPAPLNV